MTNRREGGHRAWARWRGRPVSRPFARAEMGRSSSQRYGDEEEDSSAEASWIQWYCSLRGNELFVEIDESFIADDFNLVGLRSMVPDYDMALSTILDEMVEKLDEEKATNVEIAAETLYGLVHARFILTSRGMYLMGEKYSRADFGRCPRVCCNSQPVLPVGQSDLPRLHTAKLYCPRCEDIYFPKLARHMQVDGAYFGTTFPHLFFLTYQELAPQSPVYCYVPRIYGFKIHSPKKQQRSALKELRRVSRT